MDRIARDLIRLAALTLSDSSAFHRSAIIIFSPVALN
jgi:hypothetical protein